MLRHYRNLINSLLEEVDSVEYKIEDDLRLRIRHDVFNTQREKKTIAHHEGDKKLKK